VRFRPDPLSALAALLEEQRRTTILLCGRVYDVAGMTLNGHRFVFQSHESEGGSTGETAQGYHYEIEEANRNSYYDRYKYDHNKCVICGVYEKEWEIDFGNGSILFTVGGRT
jgi:hypothetical protein